MKRNRSKYIVYSMRLGQSGVHMFKIHCVQCETLKEGTEKGGEGRCCQLCRSCFSESLSLFWRKRTISGTNSPVESQCPGHTPAYGTLSRHTYL